MSTTQPSPAVMKSVERALESNRALQLSITTELERIAKRKAENRRLSARLTLRRASSWWRQQQRPAAATASIIAIDTSENRGSIACSPSKPSNKNKKNKTQATDKAAAKGLDLLNDRPWKRPFFEYKKGQPEANPDTNKRRKLEKSTIMYHLQPPWSSKESKALGEVIADLAVKKQKQQTTGQELDYDEVARRLAKIQKRQKPEKTWFPSVTALPRTAVECKIHHANNIGPKLPPFSKDELIRMSELVHMETEEHGRQPDWESIASDLSSSSSKTERIAWDCLVAYQTKCPVRPVLEAQHRGGLLQDELFLKYIAAQGPQFVVDGSSMMHLVARFPPSDDSGRVMNSQKLLNRVNHTALNPNLANREAWNDQQERKLAICMKVYRDTGQDLYLSASHLPGRSTKSCFDKWHRSINPEYSQRPFNASEDEALMRVARAEVDKGWTDISRRHFPDRHPHRLRNRWTELATDEDILERSGRCLMSERRYRRRDRGGNKRPAQREGQQQQEDEQQDSDAPSTFKTARAYSDEHNDDAVLTTQDFVMQLKK